MVLTDAQEAELVNVVTEGVSEIEAETWRERCAGLLGAEPGGKTAEAFRGTLRDGAVWGALTAARMLGSTR